MPVRPLYTVIRQTTPLGVGCALFAGLCLSGCGPINPNFATIWTPDTETYTVEGALSRGFASRPRVAYVQREGENPDQGSFRSVGAKDAGILQSGVYVPSSVVSVGTDGRFHITFTGKPRFVLIRLFAWDDVNNNGFRDVNETLASASWDLKKEDKRGWSYNAPAWNEFNFSFVQQ